MEEIDGKCQLCEQHEETIGHLTSGCSILLDNEYLIKHNKYCKHLYYSICKALGTEIQTNGSHARPSQYMSRMMLQWGGI